MWHLQKERSHKMKGHVLWWKKQLCGQGTPFAREILHTRHCCDFEGWYLDFTSTLFLLTYQHYMSQILGIWRVLEGIGERRKWWQQWETFLATTQTAMLSFINLVPFLSPENTKMSPNASLLIHAQILSQNLTQREKNEPNTYVCLAKSS